MYAAYTHACIVIIHSSLFPQALHACNITLSIATHMLETVSLVSVHNVLVATTPYMV